MCINICMIIIWCRAGQRSALTASVTVRLKLSRQFFKEKKSPRKIWSVDYLVVLCKSLSPFSSSLYESRYSRICGHWDQLWYVTWKHSLCIMYPHGTVLSMSDVSVFQHEPKHKDVHWMNQRCHSATRLTQNGQFTPLFVIIDEHREPRSWLEWTARVLFCCPVKCDTVNWAGKSDITVSSFNPVFHGFTTQDASQRRD